MVYTVVTSEQNYILRIHSFENQSNYAKKRSYEIRKNRK